MCHIFQVFILLIYLTSCITQDQGDNLSSGEEFEEEYVKQLMYRVHNYQQNHPGFTDDRNWERATYYTGVMAFYNTVNDKKILDQAISWAESQDWKVGNELFYNEIKVKQNISSPPGRYTEHSLVSDMKKKGIGRPSTYAYITSVIQDRNYVVKKSTDGEKKEIEVLHISRVDGDKIIENKEQITYNKEKNKLFPTSVGIQVTNFLLEHFPNQMDYEYTNNVENKLDEISTGKIEWTKVVGDEYNDFMPIVKKLNGIKKDINENMFFVGKHPETDEDINAVIQASREALKTVNKE